ncbi:T9SS outer membrane translocon Sov/SprA [Wenyingzhuangia sp. IMCC45533]
MNKCFQIIFLFLFVIASGVGQEKENQNSEPEKEAHTYSFDNKKDGTLYLKNPSEEKIEYDYKIGRYIIRERIGKSSFTTPKYLTEEEYKKYRLKKDIQEYFDSKTAAIEGKEGSEEAQKDLLPSLYVNNKFFETLFGGTEIKLVPRGSVTLRLGLLYQNVEDPLLSEENRKSITPEFDQQIRANLTAKVGERLTADVNYDTQSTFSFQNQLKLEYTPGEDDILRSLEVGNINMDIKNNLITGSQSLFGVKAKLQFGATTVTGVFSQQQSQSRNIIAEGGSALTEFELRTTQYDNNRHFFLGQYFRNNYNRALERLPLINSAIQITKVEVWVTNRNTNTQDVRNVVALVDVGESGRDVYDNTTSNITNQSGFVQETPINPITQIPGNNANTLNRFIGTDKTALREIENVPTALSGLEQGREYAIVENARKLDSNEFTFHRQLGYVSLNSRLNDGDVLAIAYEYTTGGETYRVGELSTDGIESGQNLVVKLIRPQLIDTTDIVWNLLMKNIYNIGAFNLQRDGFRFNVLYRDDQRGQATNNLFSATEQGIRERTLLNISRLDRLDPNNNLTSKKAGTNFERGDGFFDFIEGITVKSQSGSIIFPVIEPFGRDLENILSEPSDIDKFVFNELYTTTVSVAENDFQDKDKFLMKGLYTSSAADGIPLGAFNVPRGSVTVTAGGIALIEGVDYTVDYFAGRVKIINPAIESSGQAINVSLENNTFFNQQQKTFVGVDVEHKFSDQFVLGATFLNVKERPITNKVQFGQDPINNSMFGLNVNYSAEVSQLTDLVNYLPNIDTDAKSNISVRGDFAYLRPSTPSSIDIGGEATTYIDDFEGAQIPINIGTAQNWSLSSVPLGFDGQDFGVGANGSDNVNDIESGFKRAKLSWYTIDQLFYNSSSLRPGNIDPNELSRAEVRPVESRELFPERNLDVTQRNNLRTFDLTYYPTERGPYNYSSDDSDANSRILNEPEENWAGITRGLVTTDFQRSNIQYIDFWLQDPYDNYSIRNNTEAEGNIDTTELLSQQGKLYINLGSISEDILRDNRKMFENGLPDDGAIDRGIDSTAVANIPTEKSLLYAFEQNDNARRNQDVGYDGMNDRREKNRLVSEGADANVIALDDPSSDNYRFFRSGFYDSQNASILRRYKDFNNPEGNSPTAALNPESFPTSATNNPDVEDADRDQTMNTLDSYWQYEIDLSKNNLNKGSNDFIIDERTTTVTLENGAQRDFKWYLFRVPISVGESIGNINSFQSIRFMRMFLTDFETPINLRFADFQLVRGDWRIYDEVIQEDDTEVERQPSDTNNLIESGVVNIEENERRVPINYILPPTISRENLQGTSNVLQQNEQSLTVTVDNLEQNKTVGVFKNITTDMRMFKRLKMFIHAEELLLNTVNDDDLVAVIRLGSDTNENYYQIEIPLKPTRVSNLSASNALSASAVWPEVNSLDVSLFEMTKVKLDRDKEGVLNDQLFPATVDNSRVALRVKGNPNLSNIRTMFLGIKNVDVVPKSAEIWFNELRLSGFDNQGGWAAQVSADANFADFAKVAVNGGYQSIGFGGIDQSVNERSQEEIKNYSINTSVNAGQLLPNDWNVRIPFNYTVSEEISTPKFDPKYEDVLSEDAKDINPNSNSTDITSKRRSISLINVKKDKSDGSLKKPKIYDIENFSVSYSYSDISNESYTIEKDLKQTVNASANYAFKFKQIEVVPFKKVAFLKNDNLSLLRDFNFNLLPSNIAVNSSVNRNFSEYKTRDLLEPGEGSVEIPTLKQRNFMFDWDYRIGYKLTKAINLDFNASNSHIFDSFERVETAAEEQELESIGLYSDFFNVGRPNNYNQTLVANYKIPIDKLPLMNFVSADYSYNANFSWQAASPSFEDEIGNTIQNGNTHNISGTLNFSKFYTTIGLKKWFKTNKKSTNKPSIGRNKASSKNKTSAGTILYNFLSAFKTARVSYNENRSSSLDGYAPSVGFLGRDRFRGGYAPGLGYVFGEQTDIVNRAVENQWLLGRQDTLGAPVYNKNFNRTKFTTLNYDVTVKPIRDLNIQFTGDRSFSESTQQQIDFIAGEDSIESTQETKSGSYNISYSLIKTAINSNPDELFNTFVQNRSQIVDEIHGDYRAQLAGAADQMERDRLESQGLNSQEVLIHSFLAAYGGNDAKSSDKTIFKKIPIPNWQITYRGLMKLGFFKKRFSNFTLSHGYNSSYTINNFSNNLNPDLSNPFQPRDFVYSGVTLVDAFSPLIKLDVKLKNSLSFRGTINTNRTLSLNLNNATLSEINGKEYVLGFGYRIKDVKIKTKFLRKRRTLKGDINIKADVSYKTDVTNIRSVDSEANQPVGGQNLLGIKVAADYNLSRSFTASLYYDQNVASYAISTLYPRQSINAGLSLVYNLGN